MAAPESSTALTFKAERWRGVGLGMGRRPAVSACLTRKAKAFPGPALPQETGPTPYWADLS